MRALPWMRSRVADARLAWGERHAQPELRDEVRLGPTLGKHHAQRARPQPLVADLAVLMQRVRKHGSRQPFEWWPLLTHVTAWWIFSVSTMSSRALAPHFFSSGSMGGLALYLRPKRRLSRCSARSSRLLVRLIRFRSLPAAAAWMVWSRGTHRPLLKRHCVAGAPELLHCLATIQVFRTTRSVSDSANAVRMRRLRQRSPPPRLHSPPVAPGEASTADMPPPGARAGPTASPVGCRSTAKQQTPQLFDSTD